MSIQLYESFLARELDTTPERLLPEYSDPQQVQMLLWPVASYFHTVAGIVGYHKEAEDEADAVLEALEANPTTWIDFTSDAARVLCDRCAYAIATLEANAREGEQVICPPSSLYQDLRRVAAALFWLHRVEMPSEWRGASLKLH